VAQFKILNLNIHTLCFFRIDIAFLLPLSHPWFWLLPKLGGSKLLIQLPLRSMAQQSSLLAKIKVGAKER